jgi:hypothetical protein
MWHISLFYFWSIGLFFFPTLDISVVVWLDGGAKVNSDIESTLGCENSYLWKECWVQSMSD